MKTYVNIMFSSEGDKPSEIKRRLLGLGFQAIKGTYDFVYSWDGDPDIDTLLDFIDRIQTALGGTNVLFSIESI